MNSLARGSASSHAGRSRVGWLLPVAMVAVGCAERPAPSCATGAAVEVDLETWGAAVEASTGSAAERDRLLAVLAMAPMPAGIADPPPGEQPLPTETHIQVTPVRRGREEADDRLVALRFRGPGGGESLRAQLLRPVPGHERLFCPLGDDLSRDQEAYEEPCLEAHEGPARALATEPLVAADRDAIVVRDAGGWCGPGRDRADRFATSWWGAEGNRLVRYLEVVTREARYRSPAPPTEVRRAAIALSDGWPRAITVTETVECHPPEEDTEAGGGCQPLERVTRYQYTDGSYAAVSDPGPRTGPAGGGEETDP